MVGEQVTACSNNGLCLILRCPISPNRLLTPQGPCTPKGLCPGSELHQQMGSSQALQLPILETQRLKRVRNAGWEDPSLVSGPGSPGN